MQIKETIGVSFPSSVESPPLEDVVVLVDSAGVALGVRRAFSGSVSGVRDGGSGLIASTYAEILLVGSDSEVSGIFCHASPRSDTRGAVAAGARVRVRAIADLAQFVVHDINNLLVVIGSGLRLLECQSDAAYRKAIFGKMQEAITRGALLSRQLLEAARPRPKSIDGFVAGSFAEGRGGAVCVVSERGGGTLVRLLLPRVHAAGLPSSIVGTEIAYTPSPNGGVFHVVNPVTAALTS
jgi:hypothetical protein